MLFTTRMVGSLSGTPLDPSGAGPWSCAAGPTGAAGTIHVTRATFRAHTVRTHPVGRMPRPWSRPVRGGPADDRDAQGRGHRRLADRSHHGSGPPGPGLRGRRL